ncbi:MAG: o-succinylbenzoate synthase [Candidatus Hydrogenedentes bacterium]|nr:o-succinylbenzoate synthase [Candidatus Hydrogenedentota bacterium]
MKITGARYYRYVLPLVRPLPLRGQMVTAREGLIVKIETDSGAEGYGEIAPLAGFSAESIADARQRAVSCVHALCQRSDIFATLPAGLRHREAFPPSVRFGIECALLDLAANVSGRAPAAILSESPAKHVPVNALLSGDTDTIVAAAADAVRRGYTAVKVKVGARPVDEDIEMIRAVRAAVHASTAIRLDANRAWSIGDATTFVRAVAGCCIAYIEEPINAPEQLAEFAAGSPVPVAVDETLQDAGWPRVFEWRKAGYLEAFSDEPEDAAPLLRAIRAAHTWVVKPTLVGFPLAYMARLLALHERIDADLVLSSSFESGVGHAALVNLAASAGEHCRPAGLNTASWFASNLVETPAVSLGTINVEDANAHRSLFNVDSLEELPND